MIFCLGVAKLSEDTESRVSPTSSGERRSDTRTATVFRPVLLETGDFAGFCLIRNLSETGMMGHVYTNLIENLLVTVQLSQDTKIAGTLIWCNEGQVGIRFDHTIDVSDMLAHLAAKVVNGRCNRAPRLHLYCKGYLAIDNRALTVEIIDVSQSGLKIIASYIRPGDEVVVEMSGLERRKATVRWTQEGVAGLNFVRPLSFEQMAKWAVAQQNGELPNLRTAQV